MKNSLRGNNEVFILVLVVLCLSQIAYPCDLPSGKRFGCGSYIITSQDDCPNTCCFDNTTTPKCYFQENAYGPIRHSNGLCLNVKSGSRLIWSKDCTSKYAFFLVSYDHPPFHLASGKCVVPNSRNPSNPANTNLIIRKNSYCTYDAITYRPTESGNLQYYYLGAPLQLCIAGKNFAGNPEAKDPVYLRKEACKADKECQDALSYVYQRRFDQSELATFQCCLGRKLEVIWAGYGLEVAKRYPLAIFTRDRNCVTTATTNVVKKKCDGKRKCEFRVEHTDFVRQTCQGASNILLVRYTCKVDPVTDKPTSSASFVRTTAHGITINEEFERISTTTGILQGNATTKAKGDGPDSEDQDHGSSASAGKDGGDIFFFSTISLAILQGILFIVVCYLVCRNRILRRQLTASIENNAREIKYTKPTDISSRQGYKISDTEKEDVYEEVGEATYASLKRGGLEENKDHAYTHLNKV